MNIEISGVNVNNFDSLSACLAIGGYGVGSLDWVHDCCARLRVISYNLNSVELEKVERMLGALVTSGCTVRKLGVLE